MSSDVEITFTPFEESAPFSSQVEALASLRPGSSTVDERIGALAQISREILRPRSELRRSLPADGLAFLSSFLSEDNLKRTLLREIGEMRSLDRFVTVDERKSLKLVPRGLTCHWVAGNVPLLGALSWSISAAIGNPNVIRLSSRQADVVSPLLRFLSGVQPAGSMLAEQTIVAYFDRDNLAAHQSMSRHAQVRIAWGGREAVDAIRDLETGWDVQDIVFGPRMSLAFVDPDRVDAAVARRLADDIATFDQLACSSPQIVFALRRASLGRFIDNLASALDDAALRYPRHRLDFAETYRIELDRARSILAGGRVLRGGWNRWTLAINDAPNETIDCANRFVQLVATDTIDAVVDFIPPNIQTVVTALAPGEFDAFTEAAANRGVCRFPMPGEGNNFDNPWDGVGLVSRLARSVLRTEPSDRT